MTATSAELTIPPMAELDALSPDAFVDAVTPLFEGGPRFLRRLADLRPFVSPAAFLERATILALALPEDEAIELVDAHPRLGAPRHAVSALSFVEQGYDRDTAAGLAADAEAARRRVDAELRHLNDAYEARFGFRYCVFVAGRSREALLPDFRAALDADREAELRRALIDVVRIAEDRYRALLGGAPG